MICVNCGYSVYLAKLSPSNGIGSALMHNHSSTVRCNGQPLRGQEKHTEIPITERAANKATLINKYYELSKIDGHHTP